MTDGLKTLPVWMINLPRATDRRVKMVARLEKIGLNFTLYPGIDGKANEAELLKSVDVKASLRNMGRPILIGGIGCYHSHLGVWKEFGISRRFSYGNSTSHRSRSTLGLAKAKLHSRKTSSYANDARPLSAQRLCRA